MFVVHATRKHLSTSQMLKMAPRWTFCSYFFHHPGTPGPMLFPSITPHTDLVLSPWSSSPGRCHTSPVPFLLALLPFVACSVSFSHPQLPDSHIGVVPRFVQVHYFITLSQSSLFNYTLCGCMNTESRETKREGRGGGSLCWLNG